MSYKIRKKIFVESRCPICGVVHHREITGSQLKRGKTLKFRCEGSGGTPHFWTETVEPEDS